MTGSTLIEILIILVLILANGFFAASEIAVVSVRRSQLERQVAAGKRGARHALALAQKPEYFLATVGIGIELIGTFTAAFGGDRLAATLEEGLATMPALAGQPGLRQILALLAVVLPITFLTMLLGELIPKRLALRHAVGMATFSAPLLTAMGRLLGPLVALLTGAANIGLRLLGQTGPSENPVTEEDIVYLAREGITSGTVETAEAQFIHRVFQFTDRAVRTVMTPRLEIVGLPRSASVAEAVRAVLTSGHARLPVYDDSLDHTQGVVSSSALLQAQADQPAADLGALLQPATFVLEHQHIADVLVLFRQQGTHLALVVDEYGLVTGMVTLTDILEELVGELPGEAQALVDRPVTRRPDGSWLVDGMEAYDAVRQQVGLPAMPAEARGGYTTIAGLVLARLGRVPVAGDEIRLGDFVIEVVDLDERRIDRLLIRQASAEDAPPPAGDT
jgi:putative hemolysin